MNRGYILLDESNIVRCMASDECALHKDKLHMNKQRVDLTGHVVGDEYDPETGTWTSHPENYPQPTEAQVAETKIRAEIKAMQRAGAIQSLKDKNELPADFEDKP
jgi:hypothetical protein